MKIVHVVPTYIPAWRYGGTIYSVHGLCKSLVRMGYEIHVFTTNVDGPNNSDVQPKVPVDMDGVKVWYFPSRFFRRIYWSPSMKSQLEKFIKNFDLVHLHSVFLWPTWMAARIAKKNKIPYIVSPRGMLVKSLIERKSRLIKTIWIHWIEKRTLKEAAALHLTSELELTELNKLGLSIPPFYIVPNGIDLEDDVTAEVRKSEFGDADLDSLRNRAPFILYLGRINWKKGLDRLIPAMKFVPQASLVIVGNDEERYTRYLRQLAKKHSVDDQVSFHGPIFDKKKKALYRLASVFVLPSYSENFGNTVLEAMAVGCPVVVTNQVGMADAVKESGAGIIVDGSSESLGKGFQMLLADETVRIQMGRSGQELVKRAFTWNMVAEKMSMVYESILRNR